MPLGFGATIRTAVALVFGSTRSVTLSTTPGIGYFPASVDIVAFAPLRTAARSDSNTFAVTHIDDTSATVKVGVVPACSSCPGLISFSTTVPLIGARMTASTGPTDFPA